MPFSIVAVPWLGFVLILLIVSASPSISLSFAKTSIATFVLSSARVIVSSLAVGAGLLTLIVKLPSAFSPAGSVAVTFTVYGLCALASFAKVPLITPLLILKPFGRLLAL